MRISLTIILTMFVHAFLQTLLYLPRVQSPFPCKIGSAWFGDPLLPYRRYLSKHPDPSLCVEAQEFSPALLSRVFSIP
ncbi:Protein of unknown function [Pyronema omphalodes CBS 100304]|uniref:Uncharacterized protein n=1 Tax=Pyronema omphalodes (strain CBS 100304) TaxID=1076935 RepID=U4LC48_PYROM|nr:Protein of unknown function [Pyronema omphalodes CBS 100304]